MVSDRDCVSTGVLESDFFVLPKVSSHIVITIWMNQRTTPRRKLGLLALVHYNKNEWRLLVTVAMYL